MEDPMKLNWKMWIGRSAVIPAAQRRTVMGKPKRRMNPHTRMILAVPKKATGVLNSNSLSDMPTVLKRPVQILPNTLIRTP